MFTPKVPSSLSARRSGPVQLGAALTGLSSVCLLLVACGSGSGPGGSPSTPPGTTPPATSQTPPSVDTTPPTGSIPGTSTVPPAGTTTAPARPSPSSPTTGPTAYAPKVISFRQTFSWGWPNMGDGGFAQVKHRPLAPAVPQLVRIAAGHHPGRPGYDRVSFTFTSGFPGYRFQFADLIADPSGRPVPVKGMGSPLVIAFDQAQAHTTTVPVRSSIVARPTRPLNLERIVDYAQAGDFEGVLTYGLGVRWAIPKSNPQLQVRVSELETVTSSGTHRYVIAFDIQLGNVVVH